MKNRVGWIKLVSGMVAASLLLIAGYFWSQKSLMQNEVIVPEKIEETPNSCGYEFFNDFIQTFSNPNKLVVKKLGFQIDYPEGSTELSKGPDMNLSDAEYIKKFTTPPYNLSTLSFVNGGGIRITKDPGSRGVQKLDCDSPLGCSKKELELSEEYRKKNYPNLQISNCVFEFNLNNREFGGLETITDSRFYNLYVFTLVDDSVFRFELSNPTGRPTNFDAFLNFIASFKPLE